MKTLKKNHFCAIALLFISLFYCSMVGAAESQVELPADSLREVVVTGTRIASSERGLPISVTTVSHDQLRRYEQSSILPSLSDYVPGLFVTSRGLLGYGVSGGSAGSMTIRGIGGETVNHGILVLIDGMPQYAGLYGHPIPDTYQTMMAERVEVLRGPASVLYGSGAMAGVVNIVTREGEEQGWKTHLGLQGGSYGTMQTELSTRFGCGKLSGAAGVNYGHTDGHRPNTSFDQYNAFAKLSYRLHPNWKLSTDASWSHFDSHNPGEITDPILDGTQHITRAMVSVNLMNHYENQSGALRLHYNFGHHQVNDGYKQIEAPQTALYLHDDRMLGVSAYQTFHLVESNQFTVGADWNRFGGKAWNQVIATGENRPIAEEIEDEWAAYLTATQHLGNWLSLNAGVRFDYHSRVGAEWVPQAGVVWHVSEEADVKANVSKGFRFPSIKERYLFRPKNPDLKPERLMNYELSYTHYLLNRSLRLAASVFYLDGEDMIVLVREGGRPLNVNQAKVENKGLELEAAYRLNAHWLFDANYSFLSMKYPVLGAPQHKAYLGANYLLDRFSLSAACQYVAGLYTQTGNSPVQTAYCLVNAKASYRLWKGLSLYVKGDNLLNQSYEVMHGFPMPGITAMGGLSLDF